MTKQLLQAIGEEEQDVGVEIVGFPGRSGNRRLRAGTGKGTVRSNRIADAGSRKGKGKGASNPISSGAPSANYLLPHMETHNPNAVEISLHRLPSVASTSTSTSRAHAPAPAQAPRSRAFGKGRHPPGTVLMPPAKSSSKVPATGDRIQPSVKKRDFDPSTPIIHVDGDPFPPCFRVVGISSSDSEMQGTDLLELQAPPRVPSLHQHRNQKHAPKVLPSSLNTSLLLNQTSGSNLTDEQDYDNKSAGDDDGIHEDDDSEKFARKRDKFLQLDLQSLKPSKHSNNNLQRQNSSLGVREVFEDEETGSVDPQHQPYEDEEEQHLSHKTNKSTRNYLQMAQKLMKEKKAQLRKEESKRQEQQQLKNHHDRTDETSTLGKVLSFLSGTRNEDPLNRSFKSRYGRLGINIGIIGVLVGIGLIIFVVHVSRPANKSSSSALQSQSSTNYPGLDMGTVNSTTTTTFTTSTSATAIPMDTETTQSHSPLDLQDADANNQFTPLKLSDFSEASQVVLQSNDQNSPLVRAYEWLLQDPYIGSYPTWQQIQRVALASFYYSTNGPVWKQADNWMKYEASECDWYPQACDNEGQIRRVILSDANLHGSLPPELFWLTSLQQLQLQDNVKLTGPIPSEIGNLSELQVLWLQKCSLSAPDGSPALPTEIGQLTSLLYLDVSSNPLGQHNRTMNIDWADNGSGMLAARGVENDLPSEIGLLTNLKELIISEARLLGTIPSEIGGLSRLEHSLQIFGNSLSGTLPTTMGNLVNLEHFYAEDNELTGQLPSELASWANVKVIDVSLNHFEGNLPTQWGLGMESIEELWVYDNIFTGPIPSQLGFLSNSLSALDMSMNAFSGALPTEICQLSLLTGLWLYQNKLTSTIPTQLDRLENLLQLSMFSNKLLGPIPRLSSNLRGLWLDDNKLTGRIPEDLLFSSTLVSIHLFSNQLRGSLPDFPRQIGSSLQELRLERNQLTGTLPTSLGNLHGSLEWLQLSQNELYGTVPTELAFLTKLTELGLEGNELTGAVPNLLCQTSSTTFLTIAVDCDQVTCLCDCVCH